MTENLKTQHAVDHSAVVNETHIDNEENTSTKLKQNILLQDHLANYNQNLHIASLGEGDFSLFK